MITFKIVRYGNHSGRKGSVADIMITLVLPRSRTDSDITIKYIHIYTFLS